MRQSLYFQIPITFQSSRCHEATLAFRGLEVGEMSALPSKHERPVLCIIIAGIVLRVWHLPLSPCSALVWDTACASSSYWF